MTQELTKRELLFSPAGVPVREKISNFPPRIESFHGKRVGLLWNSKPNGDFYLRRVAEILKAEFSDIEIIKFWEVDPRGTAHPDRKSPDALDRMAKSADIIIASTGD
ncbi:hypothetical protein ACFLXC_01955 [Chloroflexota bacterium]